jgi:hypothetical protein
MALTNIRCFHVQVFMCPGCGKQHPDDIEGPIPPGEQPRYWRCANCGWGGLVVSRWLHGITISESETVEKP